MKMLVLDHDGVIFDSLLSGLYPYYLVYKKLHPNTRIFQGQTLTSKNFFRLIRQHKDDFNLIKRYRTFLTVQEDLATIFYLVENKIDLVDQKKFYKLRDKFKKESAAIKEEYYHKKYDVMNEDYKFWLKINPDYPFFTKFIRKIVKKHKVIVATGNRKERIRINYKVHKIPIKEIFDQKLGHNKVEHLKSIKKKYSVDYSDILFIDDQVDNLIRVKRLGVKCFLNKWGHNTKDQWKLARKNGIELIDKKNFKKKIIKFMKS